MLLVCVGYFAAGWLGRGLMLASGYGSPLWPAAGLALAALFAGGSRLWPGLWLGVLLFNLSIDASAAGLLLGLAVATGATLQAQFGVWLVQRSQRGGALLSREWRLLRALLMAGPLACMVSASIAIAALWGLGRVAPVELPGEWLVWWAGDTLGVLLFAPLALLVWPGTGPLRAHWGGIWRVALPLLLTAALLGAGHFGLRHIEQNRVRAEVLQQMEDVYDAAFLPLPAAIAPLGVVASLFAAGDEVTPQAFALSTEFITRQPAVSAIDWAPRVPQVERRSFEARVRSRGLAGYRIFEPGEDRRPRPGAARPEHFPVLYSAPREGNEAALGLDHGFELSRRQAMARARDSASPMLSSVQPELLRSGREALLAFVPVYRAGLSPDALSRAQVSQLLRGYLVGVFDVEQLLAPLVALAREKQLAWRVSDITDAEAARVLRATLPAEAKPDWQRDIRFGGRTWRLEMQPSQLLRPAGASAVAQLYLGFSVLAALLAAFAILGSAGRIAATAAEVDRRTAALERELDARRAAESALQASEERYRQLVELAPFAVFVLEDARFAFVNPKAQALFGAAAPTELLGASLLERVPPDHLEAVRDRVRRCAQGQPGDPSIEAGFLRLDGSVFLGELSSVPYRHEGRPGSLVVLQDITARREAEAQRDRFFSLSLDLLCIAGLDGYFRRINPAFSDTLGWSEAELLARPFLELVHPDDLEATQAELARIASGQATIRFENRYRCKDGSWRWLSWKALPQPGGLIFATAHDTSAAHEAARQLQQLNAELREARQDAEQASRAKSAFLATMSHEIRTPMNGVVGLVDVLAKTGLSEHQAELVSTIQDSSTTLLGLIDDILDFSKIEAGRLEIEHGPVCLADLVEGLCSSLVHMAAQRNVDLGVFVAPDIPERVLGDEMRLRQVLYNLVGNAIKFSSGRPDTRGRVSVRVSLAQAEPPRLVMRVADNGIGIAAEKLDVLFNPFSQVEASTTRRFGGTGLGLAICKRLVDLMQGEIAVESRLGGGSVFTVTLPLDIAAEQPARLLPELAGVQCIVLSRPEVEADDLRVYLEHAGAQVWLVADESAAAQLATRLAGPVVLIDGAADEPLSREAAGLCRIHLRRGPPRHAQVTRPETDTLVLDGNALRRLALLRAVAVAAGRASPEMVRADRDEIAEGGSVSAPSIAEARAQGRLILVADDDEVNRRVVLQQLALLGYAAEVAHDGAEALRMWRQGRYALLLTDLHMPEMDGYRLAETIRQEEAGPGRMPILALTANALRGEARRAQEAGMDEYLTKPIRLDRLKTALARWLPAENAAPVRIASREDIAHAKSKPVMDVTVLVGLVGDHPETVRKLLGSYQACAKPLAMALQAAYAQGRLPLAADAAHKLKSASRSVGALALGELCAALEQASRAEDEAGMAAAMKGFEAVFLETEARIGELLAPT